MWRNRVLVSRPWHPLQVDMANSLRTLLGTPGTRQNHLSDGTLAIPVSIDGGIASRENPFRRRSPKRSEPLKDRRGTPGVVVSASDRAPSLRRRNSLRSHGVSIDTSFVLSC